MDGASSATSAAAALANAEFAGAAAGASTGAVKPGLSRRMALTSKHASSSPSPNDESAAAAKMGDHVGGTLSLKDGRRPRDDLNAVVRARKSATQSRAAAV